MIVGSFVSAVAAFVEQGVAGRTVVAALSANLGKFLNQSSIWAIVLTLLCFALGAWAQKKTGRIWLNPLLLGSLFVILILSLTGIPYETYKTAAVPLSYLLLPATVALAVPLYENWAALQEEWLAILVGILSGVLTSLASLTFLAWAFSLTSAQHATLLPKSVTTAIGMDVAAELGGLAPLAGAVIALTGITGNVLAVGLCRLARITEPVAKGVAIGTASHAIGTAKALEIGRLEGAMSGLAIAVAGVLTAVLAPFFIGLV